MAHEISIQWINGREVVEAMYANKPAWHGLGAIFDPDGNDAPTSADALTLAHLDWEVDLRDIQTIDGQLIKDHVATVRADTGAVLGVVGKRYKVINNKKAFEFLDSLVAEGHMRYEAAFALRGGKQVVLLARLPSVDRVAEGDTLLRYIMCRNSHDGTSGIELLPTSVRTVCANTVALAFKQDTSHLRWTIRHSGDVEFKLECARRYLSQFDKKFTSFLSLATALAASRMSHTDYSVYIESLLPAGDTDRKRQNRELIADKLRQCLAHTASANPNIANTWWAGFNSVTVYADHFMRYKKRNADENRFLSVFEGTGYAMKERALLIAAQMAGVPNELVQAV